MRLGVIGELLALVVGSASGVVAQQTSLPASSEPVPTAISRANFDTTVSPCQDFWQYVNGGWAQRIAATPPPPNFYDRDSATHGVLDEIQNQAAIVLWHLLEQARREAPTTTDPVTRVLGTYYASCMIDTPAAVDLAARGGAGQTTPRQATRALQCIIQVHQQLGNALSHAYVSWRGFSATHQAQAVALAEHLRVAMEHRIRANRWMSDSTKQQALAKLTAMTFQIGSPNAWEEYTDLTLSPTDSAINRRRIAEYEYQQQIQRIGRLADHRGWRFPPYIVNGEYDYGANTIEVPLVLFQPPLLDVTADVASNYGAIGAIIGHEITHAFDSKGHLIDAFGNQFDWWTAVDAAAFQQRANLLVNEYNGFLAIDSVHVDGKQTLAENIADLGGLLIAYDAFEQAMQGQPRLPIAGFTPEQRFFLAFANDFRTQYKANVQVIVRLGVDSHAPSRWRVNGTLANDPHFAQAFGCHVGDPMVRASTERVVIW
jgi:putative endopeptidase